MSRDQLIPSDSGDSSSYGVSRPGSAPPPSPQHFDLAEVESWDGGGFDWRRYVGALFRYKWLVLLGAVVGGAGATYAWRTVQVSYSVSGNLWIEPDNRRAGGDVAPISSGGLLATNAWTELLHSGAVLDSVVLEQRLHIRTPAAHDEAFASFGLAERFAPGAYQLNVDQTGGYTLSTAQGLGLEQGQLGDPIGSSLGFIWTPPRDAFQPGTSLAFSVTSPREAAMSLSGRIQDNLGRDQTFLSVSLSGTDPERITAILDAVMERHVALAAELKRAKLDETLVILERQLEYTDDALAQAEQDLEEFRVATITLPSDVSGPITPGIEATRGPVYNNFFDMRVRLEEIRRDRSRLEAFLNGITETGARIEALEIIPAAGSSSELRRIIEELVDARSELRALRERYADSYEPVRNVLSRIESIEQVAIPRVVGGIINELSAQERQMQDQVQNAGAELAAIPPRTIEEQRLRRRAAITENLYNELRGRVETARLAAASSIPDVRILDHPSVPQRPSEDNRMRLAGIVFLVCLGAAVGGAVLLELGDARFRYASDINKDIGLEILGSIPRIESGKNGGKIANAPQVLEAFRELRIHTGFAHGSAGPIILAISSPSDSEGKSLVSSNLAVTFAEAGRRTLLIDGDTRRGDAHRLLAREQSPGLTDYLRERAGQEIIQQTGHANLDFIGSGTRGTSTPELLASNRMAHFMGTLKRSYEVIIVDTPPLAAGGDALILSTLTGNMAVVIRTGSTEKQLTQVKLDQLSRLPIRVLGAILNDVDPGDRYYYYYSTYLPGYEPVPNEEDNEGVQLLSGNGRATTKKD